MLVADGAGLDRTLYSITGNGLGEGQRNMLEVTSAALWTLTDRLAGPLRTLGWRLNTEEMAMLFMRQSLEEIDEDHMFLPWLHPELAGHPSDPATRQILAALHTKLYFPLDKRTQRHRRATTSSSPELELE